MPEFLNVGKIVNTQGIKGEVRVISTTDFSDSRYRKGNTLYLFREGKDAVALTVASHRKHKNFDILSFADHMSINDVEAYRGGILKVSKEQLEVLPDNEFYYHEIIGLSVYDEAGQELGVVSEILSPGANDVWVVKRKGQSDVYLPYIESVVKHVSVAEGRIIADIPEGLIDDED